MEFLQSLVLCLNLVWCVVAGKFHQNGLRRCTIWNDGMSVVCLKLDGDTGVAVFAPPAMVLRNKSPSDNMTQAKRVNLVSAEQLNLSNRYYTVDLPWGPRVDFEYDERFRMWRAHNIIVAAEFLATQNFGLVGGIVWKSVQNSEELIQKTYQEVYGRPRQAHSIIVPTTEPLGLGREPGPSQNFKYDLFGNDNDLMWFKAPYPTVALIVDRGGVYVQSFKMTHSSFSYTEVAVSKPKPQNGAQHSPTPRRRPSPHRRPSPRGQSPPRHLTRSPPGMPPPQRRMPPPQRRTTPPQRRTLGWVEEQARLQSFKDGVGSFPF